MRFPNVITLILCGGSFFLSNSLAAKALDITSPNGEIKVTVMDEGDLPSYAVSFKGEQVLKPSKLGMTFREAPPLYTGFAIADSEKSGRDEVWVQPWGERKNVRDHHNELKIEFKRVHKPYNTYSVRFRVFDDGIGFRYEVPKQRGYDKVEIINEKTEFTIPDSRTTTAWWIPALAENHYEYIHKTTPLIELDRVATPFTFKLQSGVHMSIHEAALVDYASMTLDQRVPGVLRAHLTPWSDGTAVKTQTDFKSPWRTIQIAKNAIGLINSDLILNLNEPNKLGDVSWVKPGKYVGIWWGMHIGTHTWESGPKHGATTELTKKYMDFAAKYGFDGVLVEGWNIGWDGDWQQNGDIFSFTKPYPDFDIAEVTKYGKERGVNLIGHHETSGNVTNYRNQMGPALDLYQKHGVTQVKTGYVERDGDMTRVDDKGFVHQEWHDGQFMVGEYLYNIKEAAKRKISINTHEPVKDTGLRRTYPNWLSREGARGQEFNAWGSPPNPPEHTPMLAFTRMLSGPMDYTPGIFQLTFKEKREEDIPGLRTNDHVDPASENRVQSTLAQQLALYVVLYSPIHMAPDSPENYERRPDAFKFIVDVPTDWEESKAIAGEVGDYVVFARKERNGKDWYLGAVTDENSRELEFELDFLDQNQEYVAEIYRDGKNADWKTNPYDIVIEKKAVKHGDKLNMNVAKGGGFAIRVKAN